jgi:hypothetical protein
MKDAVKTIRDTVTQKQTFYTKIRAKSIKTQ